MAIDWEKTIKMKDNTLEHLFEFKPHYGIVKRTENKFRKKEIQSNQELTFAPELQHNWKPIDFRYHIKRGT